MLAAAFSTGIQTIHDRQIVQNFCKLFLKGSKITRQSGAAYMVGRLGLAAIIGLIATVGLTAGYAVHHTYKHGSPAATPQHQHPSPPHNTWQGKGSVTQHPPMPRGAPGRNIGKTIGTNKPATIPTPRTASGRSSSSPARAGGMQCGNTPPGQLINRLFRYHDKFTYELYIYPENMTIKWVVNAANKELRDTLIEHIKQMECIVSRGGTPRSQDPLFKIDAAISSKYVDTVVVPINDTAIAVTKTAKNQCAFEVIKLHAEVVKGFFETGRVEASKVHEVPDSVYKICEPYLEG